VCSFVCCIPFLYLHFTGGCSGFQAWLFNACFNVILLALFANFHRASYGASKQAKQKKAA
jgi:hypothetical protein